MSDSSGIRCTLAYPSILCRDLDALAAFYREALGLREIENEHVPSTFRALDIGSGLYLGLNGRAAPGVLGLESPDMEAPARTMLTFDPGSVSAVDDLASRMVEFGAHLTREPYDTPYGARQAVFLDPEGNVVRLSHIRVDS